MPDISLVTILSATGGGIAVPFINKLLGSSAEELSLMLGERIRLYRLQNQFKLFHSAQQMLKVADIEPKQVNLKTLLPLMEGASLEEDESLAGKWAALLANAATVKGDTLVEPSFADVLRQLTPLQAQILDKIYSKINGAHLEDEGYGRQSVALREIRQELAVEFVIFERCMDNLMRLQLCTKTPSLRMKGFPSVDFRTAGIVDPTLFGYAFVTACTPPNHIVNHS